MLASCLRCWYSRLAITLAIILLQTSSAIAHSAPAGAPSTSVWYAYVDESTEETYYHNPLTDETTWERPLGSAVKIVSQALLTASPEDDRISDSQVDETEGSSFTLNLAAGLCGCLSAFICGCMWMNRPFEDGINLDDEFSMEAKELKIMCDGFHLKAKDPQAVTIQEIGNIHVKMKALVQKMEVAGEQLKRQWDTTKKQHARVHSESRRARKLNDQLIRLQHQQILYNADCRLINLEMNKFQASPLFQEAKMVAEVLKKGN